MAQRLGETQAGEAQVESAPLDARDVAVEGAAHVLKVGEDEGAPHVKPARNDVLRCEEVVKL